MMQLTKLLLLIPAATIALGVTLGAGNAADEPGKATGISECDKYFAMVDACIATKKMSTEDQRAAEASVNRLRTMLPIAKAPEGRATLVARCTKSLELAQKDDKYGCYKSDEKPRDGRR